jgi:hypothetical protein
VIINIKDRKPIWIALSNLYLDTELQDSDYNDMVSKFIESPYSLNEIKKINKHEVFPVLKTNLISVAGVWEGFDEAWLINKIESKLKKRTKLISIGLEVSFVRHKKMFEDHFKRLEDLYKNKIQ